MMRSSAIKDLSQLADPEFFETTAAGLRLIVENVSRLWEGAAALHKTRQSHAARVLSMVAEEEATKVLILIDAIRCPKQPTDRLSRQLGYFNSHLAKGIYARVCGTRPTTFAQLREYVDMERESLYLDGPNDVDWIFRNDVIDKRERMLYVDYVRDNEGHEWSDPSKLYIDNLVPKPPAVLLASYFHDVGFFTADSLAAIADVWRTRKIQCRTRSSELQHANCFTLEHLRSRGLLREQSSSVRSWIIQEWSFPMYDLNLSCVTVKAKTLREKQDRWHHIGD